MATGNAIQSTVSGGGSGTVTSVTAADTSIVVAGTAAAPTIATGTLDVIAADHPPAANWSNNSHKITSLANGSAASDAAAFGQILALQAATSTAGYTLVNSTGNILTWTAPNDGALHRVLLFCEMHVISTLTGGQITVSFTFPDGTASNANQLIAANAGSGAAKISNPVWIIEANTTFTLAQNTAASAGSATLWAEIWGS